MNKQLRSLLQKKEKAVNRKNDLIIDGREITSIADSESRDLTAAENKRHKDIVSGLQKVNDEIADLESSILEEQKAIEAERTMVIGTDRKFGVAGGRKYAEMFPGNMANDGFRSFGDFLKAIHVGMLDDRLVPTAAASGASEGVGADGGYMVPAEYAATLLDASLESEIVRPRARIEPMQYNMKYVAGFDIQDHTAGIGGFVGKWVGEGGQMDTQKGLLRNLKLEARKLAILTAATNEIIADSPYFERTLGDMLIKALGWYLDYAYLTGDGAGKPRGVLNDPALISVAKEAGQAADTITFENLKAMFNRLHQASVPNAVWVVNQGARAQILSLIQYIETTAGSKSGTWIPVLRDDGKGGFSALGIPVLFTEKLPALGDKGDILLADFSQYIVGLRRELTLGKSEHLKFDTDEMAYRAILRADGMGAWSKPVTPKNGATLSWCVTLDERA